MARSKPREDISELTPDQQRVLGLLLEAYQAAGTVRTKPSNFAWQLSSLHELGTTDTVLRWLVTKKLAEHHRETTRLGQERRTFRTTANLRFTSASCFLLTKAGVALAERLSAAGQFSLAPAHQANLQVPHYDADRRTLFYKGQIVKQFKEWADVQEPILQAFEEEKWPRHLDDPLPGETGRDAKRRLNGAIRNLNAKQITPLLRFHGDGTGTGIIWEGLP